MAIMSDVWNAHKRAEELSSTLAGMYEEAQEAGGDEATPVTATQKDAIANLVAKLRQTTNLLLN